MDEPQKPDEDPLDREFLHLTAPGFSVRLNHRNLQTIMQYTGHAWCAVVYALGISIVIYAASAFYWGGK